MPARRRVESAEIRFGPALKALAACLLIGGAAVAYVRQQHELSLLERRSSETMQQIKRVRDLNADKSNELCQLTAVLADQVKLRRGDLAPHQAGVVVLTIPQSWPAVNPGSVKLAAGGGP